MSAVTIIEPNPIFHNDIVRAIGNLPGWRIVGAYKNGKLALPCILAECPKVIILDIDLPDMNGLRCLSSLRKRCPKAHFIIFTRIDDDTSLLAALIQGAKSYVLKEEGISGLIRALRLSENCHSYLSPYIATRLIGFYGVQKPYFDVLANLTSRQLEIIRLVNKGMNNRAIARSIKITEGAVRQHLHRIFTILQIKSRTELIARYAALTPPVPKIDATQPH